MNVDNRHGGSPHVVKLATNVRPAINLRKIKLHPLQRVFLRSLPILFRSIGARSIGHANPAPQSLNAGYGPVDYAGELGPAIVLVSLPQSPPRILDRKPGAISLGLLRRAEA
jgi:hypothetical protein